MGWGIGYEPLLMNRYNNIHFYTEEDARLWADRYMVCAGDMSRAHGAAMQFYMHQFMYLPYTFIGDIVKRKPWHVKQTVQRMEEAAELSRIPVTMNESYQTFLEDMDDFSREEFGARNPELSMVLDPKDAAWIQWNAQKASGWFDESELEPQQEEIINDLLQAIGLPPNGWMLDVIANNFKIHYHE